MAERGGAATQSGIFYQNTVAARALIGLLDLGRLPQHEWITEVRVEAPSHVDDIVIRYADGHQDWIQAKLSLETAGNSWATLWSNLKQQKNSAAFRLGDHLTIILGESTDAAMALREVCERSRAVDIDEFYSRLSAQQSRILGRISEVLHGSDVQELLRSIIVEIASVIEIEDWYRRRRLSSTTLPPASLLSDLRDIAGGESRVRGLFQAAPLRARLIRDRRIDIAEPIEWGLLAYRAAINRESNIEIPGTGISGPSAELFVWPRAHNYVRNAPTELEEDYYLNYRPDQPGVNLETFPSETLDRAIIIAPVGHGKSALLKAVSTRLADTPYAPAIIPLGSFASSGRTVLNFLNEDVNREYSVKIDWQRLAEQGLAVLLFDGLDEISAKSRRSVLRDVERFSARYPKVPWLLTVRDPAVLSGPADAQLIELDPFDTSDIQRFIDALKSRISNLDATKFVASLEAHPDVQRLARIPLFLSLLIASAAAGGDLNYKRTELIEKYLKTLFFPHEHKVVVGSDIVAPSTLRTVAEALAFDRLEQQEIGATESEVRLIAARNVDANPDDLTLRLLENGVLRRQSAIRMQFPFPIVQEYLAACCLVRNHPIELTSRIEDAVQRPWAQVIQFALELKDDPAPMIEAMLRRKEDAFFTGLRLISRCVVNGAKVPLDLKAEIERRLIRAWRRTTWRTRDQIGRLIFDGFSKPISDDLRRAIVDHGYIHHGEAEIVVREQDKALTRDVLSVILTKRLREYTSVQPMQAAVNALGDVALDMYAARAKDPSITIDQLKGIAGLVGGLNPNYLSLGHSLRLALDEALPDELRLKAFCVAGGGLDDRAWPIVERVLLSNDADGYWAAVRAICLSAEPATKLRSLLVRADVPLERRQELIYVLPRFCPVNETKLSFAVKFAEDGGLPQDFRDVAAVFAARYGSRSHMEILIDRLNEIDAKFARTTVALLGIFRDQDLGIMAAMRVKSRILTEKDAAIFASAASTGMTYLFEMESFGSGALIPTPFHPSITEWRALVDSWIDLDSENEVDRLRLLTAAHQLGIARAVDHIERIIVSLDPADSIWEQEDEYGHSVSSALAVLRTARRLIPRELAVCLIRSQRPNLPSAGIDALAAHRDEAALIQLVEHYREIGNWHEKDALVDAIERLSGQLGLFISEVDGGLTIEAT